MAEGCGGEYGGIRGLVDVLDDPEKRECVEADLIRAGMRLRWFHDPDNLDHSWRDLLVFIRHSPAGSAYYAAESGEESLWGVQEHLMANLVDLTNILVWFKTKDGQKGRNRPKPIPRPGVEEPGKRKHGGAKIPAADIADLLGMKF